MSLADDIGIGGDAKSVGDAGVVRRFPALVAAAVDDAEWGSGSVGRDAADLPVAESCFERGRGVRGGRSARSLARVRVIPRTEQMGEAVEQAQERKVVDVADVEQLPLVEVGAGAVGVNVQGVGEVGGGAVRGVVERMAEGIRKADGDGPGGLAQGGLEGVVLGVGDIADRDDIAEAQIRP